MQPALSVGKQKIVPANRKHQQKRVSRERTAAQGRVKAHSPPSARVSIPDSELCKAHLSLRYSSVEAKLYAQPHCLLLLSTEYKPDLV